MKATGIVRRIDDLGRVVVPKEIRRTLRIREGDPLEIFTDREGEIILKKYSPIGELGQFAGLYAESLAQTSGCLVCITDKEHVITDRETFCAQKDEKGFVKITLDDAGDFQSQVVSTIICEGDAIGSVVMYNREEGASMGETESKLAKVAAGFLGKQMEQ